MTDYLELLLERRRDEDEEQDVLRLGAEEGFPGKRGRKKPEEDLGGPGRDGSALSGSAADRLTGRADSPADFAAPVPPADAGPGDAVRRKTGRAALDRAVEQADALDGGETGQAGPLPAADGWTGGAAGLAGRLSQAALSAAAPARTVFESTEDTASAGADWEEFDRRLERDARRYDGGLGIY